MSANNNGGPAFPGLNAEFTGISSEGREHFEIQPSGGMTLRDYFAAKAMQGISARGVSNKPGDILKFIADDAYRLADAMLAAREAT